MFRIQTTSKSSANNQVTSPPVVLAAAKTKEKLKRSTSTGSTSTGGSGSNSNNSTSVAPVDHPGGGETNFSNEEIDNVCVNIIEESQGGSQVGMDKSNEKNIYYNDIKANMNDRGFYNEDNESYNDNEEDDDLEDADLDTDDIEDDSTQLSPIVQVKYNCEYDYDNRKFRLIEGETLFLINKSNQDWWLCLRLDENLTFFVPATYVKEVVSSSRLQPPPRPPPPPPLNRASANRFSSMQSPKPEVKKRHLVENKKAEMPVQMVYENLADSGGSSLGGGKGDNYEDDYGLSPDAIISDLDDRLNKEEESFNRMSNVSSIEETKKLPVNVNNSTVANGGISATAKKLSSNQPAVSSTTPEPDYDDKHIYQNFPFIDRKKAPNQPQPQISSSAVDKRKSAPPKITQTTAKSAPVIDRTSKIAKILNDLKVKEPASESNDDEEEEEEEEDVEESEEDVAGSNENLDEKGESSEDQELNSDGKKIYIPRGWKVELTKYRRKCFVNELNGDKWYLNHDQNGNHYFYNANNESVWQLPNIYAHDDDGDDKDESGQNFCKIIDEDLPTFKNLYSRLSNSNRLSGGAETHLADSASASGVTATSSLYPKLPSGQASSTSYSYGNNDQANKRQQPNGDNSTNAASSSASSRLVSTTVSYSNKPPSDLNSNFKCILLAKSGKKCRKKNSENYKVSLVSTKLLFVKDSKTPKLEFFVDFKGGKCYKIETNLKKSSDSSNQNNSGVNKDNNNNVNKDKEKSLKEKEKERIELVELIGPNKSAFIVETLTGYRILMINENESIINDWVYAINSIITQIQSEFSPIYEGPELLHSTQMIDMDMSKSKVKGSTPTVSQQTPTDNKKLQKKENVESNQQITFQKHSSKLYTVDFSTSPDIAVATHVTKHKPLPQLPEKPPPIVYSKKASIDNSSIVETGGSGGGGIKQEKPDAAKFGIIMKTLNAFLSRRPPIEQLKKEGIIKECVFGSNLINLCKKEKRNVPTFVDEIIASIESKGLEIDGLYRISGNLSEVQKVRHQVDHGKHNFKDFDIHVLCGALKTFFRELEDPLIPYNFHQHLINSTTIQERVKRFNFVHDLIKKMPLAHRETLRNLLRHLLKVIDLASQNRMNLQNIALVFGPNIMRSNPLNDANTGFNPHIMTQNAIVEYMLMNFRDLFSFQPNSIFTEYNEFM